MITGFQDLAFSIVGQDLGDEEMIGAVLDLIC